MIKTFLSCASAVALMSGVALAQSDDHDMTMGGDSQDESIGDITMPEDTSLDVTSETGVEAQTSTGAEASTTAQTSTDASATVTSVAQVTTRGDAEKLAETQFLLADANADGTVDKAEFTSFASSQANFGAAAAVEEPASAATTPEQAFTEIAKSDSKISEDELVEARTNSFDAADVNRDKTLDASEQQKFAALTTVEVEAQGDTDVEADAEAEIPEQ